MCECVCTDEEVCPVLEAHTQITGNTYVIIRAMGGALDGGRTLQRHGNNRWGRDWHTRGLWNQCWHGDHSGRDGGRCLDLEHLSRLGQYHWTSWGERENSVVSTQIHIMILLYIFLFSLGPGGGGTTEGNK